jgi:hypothetical protein
MEKLNILNPDIQKSLLCSKCKFIIENPWERDCCGALFCHGCLKNPNMKTKCVKCHKLAKCSPNAFVKRILNQMLLNCAFNCGKKFNSNEIKAHMIICELREYNCNICPNLGEITPPIFTGKKKEFVLHMLEFHENELLNFNDNYDKICNNTSKTHVDTIDKYFVLNKNQNMTFVEDIPMPSLLNTRSRRVNWSPYRLGDYDENAIIPSNEDVEYRY